MAGKNGNFNVGKNLRLQFYYSNQSRKNNQQICNAWVWWKEKKLKKYPSSLYINIRSIVSPTKIVETFRSKTPVQKESSSRIKLCDEVQNTQILNFSQTTVNVDNTIKSKEETFSWTRKHNEICKFPNKGLVQFNSGDQGCFVLKFSPSGKYLACAVQSENLFYIIIYSVCYLLKYQMLIIIKIFFRLYH